MSAPAGSIGIDDLLMSARTRITRYSPDEAQRAVANGAVLIDIRPVAQRTEFGEIPGAIIIERNVLEWRLDPRSENRIVDIARYDAVVIVFCQEGYTSSLAADALRQLGLVASGDLDGGFSAWRDAGLPTSV